MPAFEPQDPDFAERVRASFARQAFMAHIGAELVAVTPGACEIHLPSRAELTQQHGFVHGGAVGAIVDSAMGYAGYTLAPAGSSVLTVEFIPTVLDIDPFHGCKSARPGRRGAQPDAAHRASAATPPAGRFGT